MNITTVSAKVMLSYDYSHFEVAMCATLGDHDIPSEAADDLRMRCARAADKAVSDYKRRKAAMEFAAQSCISVKQDNGERTSFSRDEFDRLVADAKTQPEGERTPRDKAVIKLAGDLAHAAKFDYGRDWEERDCEDHDERP